MPTETIVISHSLHLIYTFWRLREPPLYEVLWEDSWRVHWTVNPKGNQHWIFTGRTDAEAEAPILWPPDAKSRLTALTLMTDIDERLRAGGEGGNRGWDGWIASLTQWTCVWANSGRWWRTGRPGMLQLIRLQRVGHDWTTEQQQQTTSIKAPGSTWVSDW